MRSRNELIAYAMDFASFLIMKRDKIDRIILYGSVARGDFDEDSDVDLFIDIKDNKVKGQIGKILESYYKTKKFNEWKLKGVKNEISLLDGDLNSEEWKDLKRAIVGNGIVLYDVFNEKLEGTYQYTLFSFENIKPDKKRVLVFRKLFGFRIKGKNYDGLINKLGGKRIGKGIIIVPISKANELKSYFKQTRITFKVYDFWSDVEL